MIKARQMSSAMSAAKAAVDHMKDIWQGTADGEHVSMGVVSDGSYGIAKDVVFSFPVTIKNKTWTIVQVSEHLFTSTMCEVGRCTISALVFTGLTDRRFRAQQVEDNGMRAVRRER